jgi:hypothetical protein
MIAAAACHVTPSRNMCAIPAKLVRTSSSSLSDLTSRVLGSVKLGWLAARRAPPLVPAN